VIELIFDNLWISRKGAVAIDLNVIYKNSDTNRAKNCNPFYFKDRGALPAAAGIQARETYVKYRSRSKHTRQHRPPARIGYHPAGRKEPPGQAQPGFDRFGHPEKDQRLSNHY
jgi:hypothetical protein